MIFIIRRILNEMDYDSENSFTASYALDDEIENREIELYPFISKSEEGTCILVCHIDERDFIDINDKELIIAIASNFRGSGSYIPEMDKNTSLILCIKRQQNASLTVDKQRRLEDDPFYFKKYILIYSQNELDELNNYLKTSTSALESLTEYIHDKDNFNRYKQQPENQQLYSVMTNLTTKIPIIPLSSNRSQDLFEVAEHFINKYDKEHSKNQRMNLETAVVSIGGYPEDGMQDIEKLMDFALSLEAIFEGSDS